MGESAATHAPRDRIGGRYRIVAFRGAGSEGSVYLADDLFSGEQVALKVGAAARLAAEYERSSSFLHPNLARAIALWPDGAEAALSYEYAHEDFSALRGSPEEQVVRHVAGIARALAYLHRRGVVHADVKPQNAVLVDSGGARRALLVDLGLAGAERTSRGSLEYAAPEVLEGSAPTPASDLYSLGVTLHELLSAANPFARPTPVEVVRAHFVPPPPLRASSGIQAVVAKLLARDPHSRYARADEVIEALASATGLDLQPDAEGLAPDCIGLGALRGREGEQAGLAQATATARAGRASYIVLTGARGSGKSRLLDRLKIAAELAGMRTMRVTAGRGVPTLCRWLGILLGDRPPSEPTVALAQKWLAAACERHPIALLLDDADDDPGLCALAGGIARSRAWKRRPLLLAAAADAPLDEAIEAIELKPLPRRATKEQLREVFGSLSWSERLSETLCRETSGVPADAENAVLDLLARGILAWRRGRWELNEPLAGRDLSACIPRAALRAAAGRVRSLPEPVRETLGLAAVLGGEIDRAALNALVGTAGTLTLEKAGLLEAEGTRLRFAQLALVRAAERALSPERRRNGHRRAAELAADAASRALHLFRARSSGCIRAALAAARIRGREGAPAEAARLYQIACAARRAPFSDERSAVLVERSGDCRALAGDPAAARLAYARALARGGDPGRLWQKVARARWQEGQFDGVLAALAKARAGGGDELAIAIVEARAQAMRGDYQRASQLATDALPLSRARGDADSATRLHHLLGTCAWHRGDGRRAVAEERAAVLIARRLHDRRAEADARMGLGTAYRLLSSYRRAALETSKAIELYAAIGDERQEALAWNNLGVARYLAGEWDRALEAWEKLTAKKSRTLEEELLTLNNLGYLYRERGDLPRAKELLRRALAKIREAGGYARMDALVRGNLGEVAAREGDLGRAAALYSETLEIARRIDARDEVVETERRLAELDLLRRDPAAAQARAKAALDLATRAESRVEQGNLMRILALAAHARRDSAAADAAAQAARAALQQAGAALELARLDCVTCLLELDRADAVQAETALRRARGTFEKLGAAPDLREVEALEREVEALQRKSLSQVEALARAAQRLGASSAPAALLEEVLDQALQLTGAERGFILLNEGSGPARVAAVRGADANATLHISRTIADGVLHTGEMVAIADIVGRDQLSTQKSILDLGLRSVLCAPIRSGGKQLGILYVDSRRVGVLLSEKDLGLLSAFAALAGSALENARLIDDLRRKSDLLSHMAHEFRTPLVGIKGYADLVRDDPALPAPVRKDIDVISEQALRLSNLVDRTLELARMEAGAAKLARSPVSVAEVAGAAIAGLKPLALMKSIAVELSAEEGTPAVLGDFERLVQVITNLVGNAVHYSPNGKRVWVRVHRGDPLAAPRVPRIEVEGSPSTAAPAPRPSVRLTVSDEGPGIPPESIGKLFTPFFRAGNTKRSGTGLGLMITQEIVRHHGGEIRVESDLGRGTTFTIVLPGAP